jgi:hypothetical protein
MTGYGQAARRMEARLERRMEEDEMGDREMKRGEMVGARWGCKVDVPATAVTGMTRAWAR